jgi:hypothetical protein
LVTAGWVLDHYGVLVEEAAVAGVKLDVIADQLRPDKVALAVNDVLCTGQQVGRGDVLLDTITCAVEFALSNASQVEHRFTQRLGRDRAGVGAHSAEHLSVFDHRH